MAQLYQQASSDQPHWGKDRGRVMSRVTRKIIRPPPNFSSLQSKSSKEGTQSSDRPCSQISPLPPCLKDAGIALEVMAPQHGSDPLPFWPWLLSRNIMPALHSPRGSHIQVGREALTNGRGWGQGTSRAVSWSGAFETQGPTMEQPWNSWGVLARPMSLPLPG